MSTATTGWVGPVVPIRPVTSGPKASLAAELAQVRQRLAAVVADGEPGGELLEALRGLEELTRTAAAATARLSADLYHQRVAGQARDGVPAARRGAGVADDLAVTRKTSPSRASTDLVAARALTREMPCTLQALAEGHIDVDAARMMTQETVCLDAPDRGRIDEQLAPRMPGISAKELRVQVRALAQELDPASLAKRAARGAKDRGVWMRPAPDVMAILSTRLPAPAAVACYRALSSHAETARACGDERSKAQIMADELYARLTGRTVADGIDVEVELVMTDATLFAGDPASAILNGYGPVPAPTARDLLRTDHDTKHGGDPPTAQPGDTPTASTEEPPATPVAGQLCPDGPTCTSFCCHLLHGTPAPGPTGPSGTAGGSTTGTAAPGQPRSASPSGPDYRAAQVWLRRLYADPATGALTSRDTRRRTFTGSLRSTIIARDQYCRSPWCGAPIRHIDHKLRWVDDGRTTDTNGQGLCARCNLAREHARQIRLRPEDYLTPPPIVPTLSPRPG